MLITIDGVAGSGKTTLAQFMSQEFRHHSSVQVVHMDDLYEGWEDPLGTELSGKLQKIAEAHNNRLPLKTTMYDWESSRAGAALEILPVELLILEGVGSGQRSIREFVEKKIWIDLEPLLGLGRVLSRDGDAIAEKMLRFMDEQRAHFAQEGTREAADIHLNGLL
jgi:uridine kinase